MLQDMGSHRVGHDLVTEKQYSFFYGVPSVIVQDRTVKVNNRLLGFFCSLCFIGMEF